MCVEDKIRMHHNYAPGVCNRKFAFCSTFIRLPMSDNSRLQWHFMTPKRTIMAITTLLVSAGLLILIRLNLLPIVAPYSQFAVVIISLPAFLSFFGAMHGGTILKVSLRELHRWRGPFIPLWTQRISFESIRKVQVGPGIYPGSAQAARRRNHSYHVAVISNRGPVIVRWTNSLDDAKHYAGLIARVAGCPAEEHVE